MCADVHERRRSSAHPSDLQFGHLRAEGEQSRPCWGELPTPVRVLPPNPHADAVGRVVREPAEVQKERAAEAQQANAARAGLAREKNEGKTKMKVGGWVAGRERCGFPCTCALVGVSAKMGGGKGASL